jgi:hypothetical protein
MINSNNTFATDNSPENLQKYAQFLIFPLEIIAFIVVLILSNNILVWFFMGIYLFSEWRRQKDPSINIIIVAPQNDYDRFAMYKMTKIPRRKYHYFCFSFFLDSWKSNQTFSSGFSHNCLRLL